MKISYAIPVCNEREEIERLLSFLIENKRDKDEIVIFYDVVNGTKEVWEYLRTITLGLTYNPIEHHPIRWYSYDFDGDFSEMKNELTEMCTGDYIFQIDADELPHKYLVDYLHEILDMNNIDVMRVPRINTVKGITEEHIQKWGWNVNEKEWVNFPDYQWRIYRRNDSIRWKNKVHEVLEGYKTMANFPPSEEFSLYHPKTIERQEKQNNYYNTL
jgi:hypothetical protein